MEFDKSVESSALNHNVDLIGTVSMPTGSLAQPLLAVEEPKSPLSSSGEIENVLSVDADRGINSSEAVPETSVKKRITDDCKPADAKKYRLKRRKIKAAGAPKMPLTGYVRYMNVRREQLRAEFPEKTSIEYTKMIGEEWSTMSEEKKLPFLKEAEVDRQRYITELNDFLKDRPDILASELAKNKIRKRKENLAAKSVLTEKTHVNGNNFNGNSTKLPPSPKLNENISVPSTKYPIKQIQTQTTQTNVNVIRRFGRTNSGGLYDNGSIPIFTEEFLEHNKCVDMELRTLRKSHVDFEQQNAVLEKHVENMKFGVEKMTTENDELQEKNRLLEMYLDKLKLKLTQALSGLAIPTEPNGATLENIDKYMSDLFKMATTNTHGPASLNKAKDIIRKLDLTIHL